MGERRNILEINHLKNQKKETEKQYNTMQSYEFQVNNLLNM
jgi:hypothetical protein